MVTETWNQTRYDNATAAECRAILNAIKFASKMKAKMVDIRTNRKIW